MTDEFGRRVVRLKGFVVADYSPERDAIQVRATADPARTVWVPRAELYGSGLTLTGGDTLIRVTAAFAERSGLPTETEAAGDGLIP